VVRSLKLFEKPGGLETSINLSGNQWDAPFAWAPLEMIAVEGLRRNGNHAEAERISRREFLSLVKEQYRRHDRREVRCRATEPGDRRGPCLSLERDRLWVDRRGFH
jgi:neutral trehalase